MVDSDEEVLDEVPEVFDPADAAAVVDVNPTDSMAIDDEDDGEDDGASEGKVDLAEGDDSSLRFSGHKGEVFAVAVHPTRDLCVSGGMDDLARVWDISTGKELLTLTVTRDFKI